MSEPIKTDRISDLPPEIVHNILYRLDWSEAARSCILSKTWYSIFWRSYPVVEYHDFHYYDPLDDPDHEREQLDRFQSFAVSSCERLLIHHIPNRTALKAFRISWLLGGARSHYLLRHFLEFMSLFSTDCGSPLEVSIRADGYFTLELLRQYYSRTEALNLTGCSFPYDSELTNLGKLKSVKIKRAKTCSVESIRLTDAPFLESLELDYLGLKISSPCSAPNLKTLRISNYREVAPATKLIDDLICNLPSLESLSIEKSLFLFEGSDVGPRWLTISSPKLRELSLTECSWCDHYSWGMSKGIEINAPNLEAFRYTYQDAAEVGLTEFKFVEKARKFRFVAVLAGSFEIWVARTSSNISPSSSSVQLTSKNLLAELSTLASNCKSTPLSCVGSALLQQQRKELAKFFKMPLEAICEANRFDNVQQVALKTSELTTDPLEKTEKTTTVAAMEAANGEVSRELRELKRKRDPGKEALENRLRAMEKLAQFNASWKVCKENLGL
ncbi:hypothetical protein LINGRAHAP2_LOCUS35969 [Linum grandiflorum]